ncbi:hypothetical protein C8R43DRAFT_1128074 [Mycena crocata]|nr:hypothetical protein C8R43DRAFT_1128074 [Mycena crocata]
MEPADQDEEDHHPDDDLNKPTDSTTNTSDPLGGINLEYPPPPSDPLNEVDNEVVQPATGLNTPSDAKDLLAAKGGYAGKWNGYDAQPLVDAQGHIFAVLTGQPRNPIHDPTYAATVARAYETITKEGAATRFPYSMCHHRCGLFATMNVRLSYGKGQIIPSWLITGPHTNMVECLLADNDIKRMATFASTAFCLWAPPHTQAHPAHLLPPPRLRFRPLSLSCTVFNFRPNVWMFHQHDVLNLLFDWCAVQSGSPFDTTKGGHLVLWDLMLVVKFPPGALILLLSATINHSNVPMQEGDKQVSFTQFTASSLIRFVDNGFRTEAELKAKDPAEYARICAQKETRFEMGLELFSTMDKLLSNVEAP